MIQEKFLIQFKNKLKEENIKVIEEKAINYGNKIIVVDSGNNNSVSFNIYYSSKKGYSIVFTPDNQDSLLSDKIKIIYNKLFFNKEYELYKIGADEAGKGDYFGPLVISAVLITEAFLEELYKLRLKESKSSNDKLILKFYNKIKKYKKNYETKVITNKKLNDLIIEKRKIGKTLNDILDESYYEIILRLLHKNSFLNVKDKINSIIIDRFGKTKKINDLINHYSSLKLIVEPKAEKYLPVLVASIVSKAIYIIELNKMKIKYGIDFKKGASDIVLQQREYFINRFGEKELKNVGKVFFNFKNLSVF